MDAHNISEIIYIVYYWVEQRVHLVSVQMVGAERKLKHPFHVGGTVVEGGIGD